MVYEKMYESNDNDELEAIVSNGGYKESTVSAAIRARMKRDGKR